jgi:deoxyribose-phosphate aldolase
VGNDLNALAAQLASQLATTPYPGREAAGQRDGLTGEELTPPPRGVLFTEGEARLGDFVDHTLLRPDATLADVERLCGEALEHRLGAVCLNPVWVADAARLLRGSGVALATVVGFPFGASHPDIKAAEALLAVRQGAQELDVVVPLGALRAGQWGDVERDVAAVVRAADGALVKVVLESALLAPLELVTACLVARDAGAHYVKTSTGFHAAGGATAETVALMRLAVGDALGVKASGGVRDGATALAMLAAGATRIGTSAGAALAEVRGPGPRRLRALLARERRGAPTPPGGAPTVPVVPPSAPPRPY